MEHCAGPPLQALGPKAGQWQAGRQAEPMDHNRRGKKKTPQIEGTLDSGQCYAAGGGP